jgi:hypothetical protein
VVVVVVAQLERGVAPLEVQEELQLRTAPQVQLTQVLVVEETLPTEIVALVEETVAPVL